MNKCEDCKFSSGWTMTNHTTPRINKRHAGNCDYFIHKPKPIVPKFARRLREEIEWTNSITAIPDDKSPCPVWEEKL